MVSHEFKKLLMKEFEMTNLGRLKYFLGMEFVETEQGLILNQKKYASEILARFDMEECNIVVTPADGKFTDTVEGEGEESVDDTLYKQVIGSLRYLCNSRPDICFAVGVLSKFMQKPQKKHLLAAKRVMRYIKGTLNFGILFPKPSQVQNMLIYYSNADWCGDGTDRISTTGCIFLFMEAPISWWSKKQSVVALSTCEAEYIVGSSAACQAVWLNSVMEEMGIELEKPIKLLVDNKSTIDMAINPVSHGRSKHIETRFHYIRDQVNNGKLKLIHCPTQLQIADILTKPLKKERFKMLREQIGVYSVGIKGGC